MFGFKKYTDWRAERKKLPYIADRSSIPCIAIYSHYNFFVKKRHKPPVNQITDGLYKVKWICGSIIGLLNCYPLEVFFQLKTNHCSEEYPLLRKESDR